MKKIKFYRSAALIGLVVTMSGCNNSTNTTQDLDSAVTEPQEIVTNEDPTTEKNVEQEIEVFSIPETIEDENQLIGILEEANSRIDQTLENIKDSKTLNVILNSAKHGFVQISKYIVSGNMSEDAKETVANLIASIDQKLTDHVEKYPEFKESTNEKLSAMKNSAKELGVSVIGEENWEDIKSLFNSGKNKVKGYWETGKDKFESWLDKQEN